MVEFRNKLDEFRSLTKDIVNNACLKALLKSGYTPDDSNITIEQTAYGKLSNISCKKKYMILKIKNTYRIHSFVIYILTVAFTGMKFKMPKDGILKMSYIEQVRKRDKCYRLSWYIKKKNTTSTSADY